MYKSLPHLNESDIFYIRLRLHKKWLMAIGYVVGGKYESKVCANSKLNKRCFI